MINPQTFVYPIISFSDMLNFVEIDHFVQRISLKNVIEKSKIEASRQKTKKPKVVHFVE